LPRELSPGPVLPQFADRTAAAIDVPAGRETGQCVYPTLQEGTCVRGEYRISRGVSLGETGSCNTSAADAWLSRCQDANGVGARDEFRASKCVSNEETGSCDGADTWPSGRDSSAFQQVGGGDEPPPVCKIATAGEVVAAENSVVHKGYGGVKLEKYDGTTCLETFLAAVRNFSTYHKWNEDHLKASLRGPAGQVLWDLVTKVTLDDLVRLLRKRFGTSDPVEYFNTELHTRRGDQRKICRVYTMIFPD